MHHTYRCSISTAYCLLPTAYCLLPTAYCLLPTAVARELDARTDKPLAPHHRISFVGQRGRLDVILRGKAFASSDHLHGMRMEHRPALLICACVA